MSVTEVLRRLLDERGVEYETDDEDGCEFTEWMANGLEWEADSRGELVSLMPVMLITPEQAIAATLGATDAKPMQAESSGACHQVSCNCSDNCTNGERTGTCHDTGKSRIFHCSECGLGLDDVFIDDEEDYPFADFPCFCPFCGAEVVEPTTNDVDAEVSDD